MIAIAHFIAISCYIGAAALAATPFVRPVAAPVRAVTGALGAGVLAHLVALVGVALAAGRAPVTGLGPALSFAAILLAATLLVAEWAARDVTLTLIAAPLAALATTAGNIIGLTPLLSPQGAKGAWLFAHIALSFVGLAAFTTAAAAGAVYLVERRELRSRGSRRLGALLRIFPPLETLDRVNHHAAVVGWVTLTVGIVLAVSYSFTYGISDAAEVVWGTGAWLTMTALVLGRVLGGWQARRAAVVSSVAFVAVIALYVACRAFVAGGAQFL